MRKYEDERRTKNRRFSFYPLTIRKIPPLHTHERRRTKSRTRAHYFCYFLQKFTNTKLFVYFYYEFAVERIKPHKAKQSITARLSSKFGAFYGLFWAYTQKGLIFGAVYRGFPIIVQYYAIFDNIFDYCTIFSNNCIMISF